MGIIEKYFLIGGNRLEMDTLGNNGSYEAWIQKNSVWKEKAL